MHHSRIPRQAQSMMRFWQRYFGVSVADTLRVLHKVEIPKLLVPSSLRTKTAEGLVAQKNIYDLPFLNNGTMRKEYQLCFKHQNIQFTVELFRCQHCKSNQHNKKQRVPNMKNYDSDKFSQSSSRWYVDEWTKVEISQLFLSSLHSSQQVCTWLSVKLPVATKDAYFNVVVISGDFKFLLNNTVQILILMQ